MACEPEHGGIAGETVPVLDHRRSTVRNGLLEFATPVMAMDKCLFKINFILITKSLDDPFNILNQG
jgi:hypothetical protein